jgi:hypothetical protein
MVIKLVGEKREERKKTQVGCRLAAILFDKVAQGFEF